jgi:DNA-binding transcriptional ArsR family regulator
LNYFTVADKINQLHKLSFAERALLTQITSYHFNNKTFFASNEYLANYMGVTERSITRYVTKLKNLGFITLIEDNKLNAYGKWDNRRYITPILENIISEEVEKPEPIVAEDKMPVPVIESEPEVLEIVESSVEETEEKQYEDIDSYLSDMIHVDDDDTAVLVTPVKTVTQVERRTIKQHLEKLEYKWATWLTHDKFVHLETLFNNLGITHTDAEELKDEKLLSLINNQLEYLCDTTGKYMKIKIF